MITIEELKDNLSYDALSGIFTRIKAISNKKVGSVAGFKKKGGYIEITINKRTYGAHGFMFMGSFQLCK